MGYSQQGTSDYRMNHCSLINRPSKDEPQIGMCKPDDGTGNSNKNFVYLKIKGRNFSNTAYLTFSES